MKSTEEQTIETLCQGFELLCSQSRIIAMLPLEEWDAAFDKAETIGPITDPTLYRNYLYSDKAKVIREVIKAAIHLKQVVLKSQDVARHMLSQENSDGGL